MNTPPKLTEGQIRAAVTPLFDVRALEFALTVSIDEYRAIESARDAQWLEHLKSNGWRQCAEGQGVSQSCPQAEELARMLREAIATKAKSSEPAPKREWVGLTDVEWMNIVNRKQAWFGNRPDEVACEVTKLVEAKLKELNHG